MGGPAGDCGARERGQGNISSVIFSESFSWDTLVWLGLRNKEHNTVSTRTSSRLASGGPLLTIMIFPT